MKKKVIFAIALCIFIALAYAGSFEDIGSDDFNGTYSDTFYNSSGFIQLNETIPGDSWNITINITELFGNESGLISYWRLNESYWNGVSGEVKDVLGKNNGTSIAGANTTSGLFGRAGNFDGIDDRVSIANKEELNPLQSSFTITGWAKSYPRAGGASGQWQLYVAKRTTAATNGYYVGFNQGNGLNFMVGNGTDRYDTALNGGSGYVPIAYDTWFHFAAVINRTSNQTLLYVNGTLSASRTFTTFGGNINNSANLSLGLDYGQVATQGGYPVNGSVDEVAIWDRALNSSEILELYQKGINSTTVIENATYFYNGTYESNVRDAGGIATWGNISWNGYDFGSLGELPDNQQSDSGISMSGNVLLMHMNEASGEILDTSGNRNNGTQSGGIGYNATGKFNSALSFDGANDYVNILNSGSLNLSNTLTISAWVYPLSLSNRHVIYSTRKINGNNGQFQLEIGQGNSHTAVVVVAGYNTWVVETADNAVTLNAWNHIVYTRNGTGNTHKVYVNGQLQTLQTTTAYDFADNTNDKLIGAGTNLLAMHFFNGTIEEVAVFNRTLSPEEVSNLYNRNGSASNLKFQVRAGNTNPITSDYVGADSTNSSYFNSPGSLNLSDSRYIQYKAFFTSSSDKLYNVSIDYTTSGENISVSLDSPADNYLTNEYNINITCSASSFSELSNITVYYDKFGWAPLETKMISGTSNITSFILGEIVSPVIWNCLACNMDGNCVFASSNKTIIGDILAPEISLVSPDEGYEENSTSTVNFVFNATDNRATSLSCKLLIDDIEVANNSSVLGGVNTTFNVDLSNGDYDWKVNCSDGINFAESSSRNITVNYSVPYVPFWAKANTHTHTTNSDGDSSPATVIGLYQAKGYNILAITDHGYVTNCTPFTNSSFMCINSEEWTSTKHVVRINISAPYNNAAINLQNAVNAAQDEGGFAIVAHPNWSSTIWSVAELSSLQNYTAMEIYNKVIERLTPDPYAVKKWDSVLISGKKIFGVASDDMHQVNVDLGYGFTKVYMPEFSKQAYINSMKAGYFYASQGPSMDDNPFTLSCDEINLYHMGESANCSAVRLNATISATNSSFTVINISLIKDGVLINFTVCSSQNCSFSYSENVSSSGYYRIEAIDSANKKIWSNPIWVTKIALPVIMTVNSPENNSVVSDYTPLVNITLNQKTTLWYSLGGRENITLCMDCSSYSGGIFLVEGANTIKFYANNSDNTIKEENIYVTLNFNKTFSENFSDNYSVASATNVSWNNGKMSLGVNNMFGDFILKPIVTLNNLTSFFITWQENNTEGAKGEGQRVPIILKYKIDSSSWVDTDSYGGYIINGTTISGLNGKNLSLMFDFEKNPTVPVDLLNFRITWTEFTVPLIFVPISKTTTSSSATISWNTDIASNSSIEYGDSVLLGSALNDDNFVINHSLTIPNLNQNTVYYFKIISCTNDSCAEYPQSSYPVDSFTTQIAASNPPSGSGGGGGGGGGAPVVVTPKIYSIEIDHLSDIIIDPGQNKKLVLKARNNGTFFLNECKLLGKGENMGWISSSGTKGLSAGEEYEFTFNMKVPDKLEAGSYLIQLFLTCIESNSSASFRADIIEKKLKVSLVRVEKDKEGKVKVTYSLEELSNVNQQVQIDISLINKTNQKVAEFKDLKTINAASKQEFEAVLSSEEELSGTFSLLINALSDTSSAFVQEDVVLGNSKISGLAILGDSQKNLIFSIILIAVFLAFAGLVVFRMLKFRGFKKRLQLKSVISDKDEGRLQAQGIPSTSIEAIKEPF